MLPAFCLFLCSSVWEMTQISTVYTLFLDCFPSKPRRAEDWPEREHLLILASACHTPKNVCKEGCMLLEQRKNELHRKYGCSSSSARGRTGSHLQEQRPLIERGSTSKAWCFTLDSPLDPCVSGHLWSKAITTRPPVSNREITVASRRHSLHHLSRRASSSLVRQSFKCFSAPHTAVGSF